MEGPNGEAAHAEAVERMGTTAAREARAIYDAASSRASAGGYPRARMHANDETGMRRRGGEGERGGTRRNSPHRLEPAAVQVERDRRRLAESHQFGHELPKIGGDGANESARL